MTEIVPSRFAASVKPSCRNIQASNSRLNSIKTSARCVPFAIMFTTFSPFGLAKRQAAVGRLP
jgi:hypothetical protein